MSDVVIRGMEMPKSCDECRLFNESWCMALSVENWRKSYNKPPEGGRLPDCPLVPLPEGHGELIDKQAFIADIDGFIECMTKAGVVVDGDRLWKAFLGDFVPPEHPVAVQEPKPAPEPDDEVIQPPVCDPGEPEPEENGTVETEPEPRPAPEPKAPTVSTVVRAFRVDITGPLDAVLRRLDVFAALVGNLDVRITLSIDEGDAS